MSVGRYTGAYNLLRDILVDPELNAFVRDKTKKSLAVIDSGPVVTTPAAGVSFRGATRDGNAIRFVQYGVEFKLPFFGADCMKACHEFLDAASRTFLKRRAELHDPCHADLPDTRVATVIEFQPTSIEEISGEIHYWNISVLVTIVV